MVGVADFNGGALHQALILPTRPPRYVARFGTLAAIGATPALFFSPTALFVWPERRSCCSATCFWRSGPGERAWRTSGFPYYHAASLGVYYLRRAYFVHIQWLSKQEGK